MRFVYLALLAVAAGIIAVVATRALEPLGSRSESPFELTLGEETARKLMAVSAAAQKEGENGWPLLIDAISVLDELHSTFEPERLKRTRHRRQLWIEGLFYSELEHDDLQIAIEALALFRQSRVYETLKRAGESAQFVMLIESGAPVVDTGPLAIRRLAQVFRTSMQQAALDNDGARIVMDAECMFILARAASYQPDALSRLIAESTLAHVIDEIQYAMSETQLDEQYHRELLRMIDSLDIAPYSIFLEGERLRLRRMVDGIFDGSHSKDELQRLLELVARGLSGDPLDLLLPRDQDASSANRIKFASREEMHAGIDRAIDEQLAILARPWPEWKAAAEALEGTIDNIPKSQPFTRMAYVGLGGIRSHTRHYAKGIDGTRLLLALHAYKAAHGKFPQALNELVPQFLPVIPTDHSIGKPFGYRLSDGSATSCVLYMYGIDGEDDGGVLREEHEWRAFDKQRIGEGYDFIINRPRPPH